MTNLSGRDATEAVCAISAHQVLQGQASLETAPPSAVGGKARTSARGVGFKHRRWLDSVPMWRRWGMATSRNLGKRRARSP